MAVNFSDNDKKKLINLAPLYHYKIIADMLGKSPYSVAEQARALGIKLISDNKCWTLEEDMKLIDLCEKHHRVEIAAILDRTYGSVSERCEVLGVKPLKKKFEFLDDEEKEQIEQLAPFHTISEISKILERPYGTVEDYLRRNDIEVYHKIVISDDELVDQIAVLALDYTIREIAEKLNLTYDNVYYICRKSGIVAKKDKIFWTDEQKEKFKELAKTYSSREIADIMGMKLTQILDMGKYLGIELIKSHYKWTREQLEILKQSDGCTIEEVLIKINKPRSQIWQKANFFGITLVKEKPYEYWTSEEDKKLREVYSLHTFEELSSMFGRSIASIKGRAVTLSLVRQNLDDSFLVKDIVHLFGISEPVIRRTWIKRGLNLVQGIKFQTVSLKDLLLFLKSNPDLWNATKLPINIFGKEEQWLIEKREQDAFVPPKTRYWSKEETNLVIKLFIEGKSLEEIAMFVDRTETAINYRLKEHGYCYSPNFTEEEIKFIRQNCKNMTSIEIAKVLNTRHEASIRLFMHRENLYWENNSQKQLVIELYKQGKPINEIAKVVNRNIKSVATLLRENGFNIQSFTSWNELEPLLIDLYKQGKSLDEMLEYLPDNSRGKKALSLKLCRMRKKGIID